MKNESVGVFAINMNVENLKKSLPPHYEIFNRENFKSHEANIQSVITTPGGLVDETLIAQFPNLKIISCFGVGTDSIDLKAAAKKNIIVTNTPEVVTADTADIALALLISVSPY